jgi:hypothetical protein
MMGLGDVGRTDREEAVIEKQGRRNAAVVEEGRRTLRVFL